MEGAQAMGMEYSPPSVSTGSTFNHPQIENTPPRSYTVAEVTLLPMCTLWSLVGCTEHAQAFLLSLFPKQCRTTMYTALTRC